MFQRKCQAPVKALCPHGQPLQWLFATWPSSIDIIAVYFSDHRISQQDIQHCFDWLRKDKTVSYICGPSPMITDVENMLLANGLQASNIRYEKWWW